MPVVEKIATVAKNHPQYNGLEQRFSPFTYNKESVYKAVVEFIKWYNKNKND